jgi:hypothetical protein
VSADTGYLFTARWPILDQDRTVTQLRVEAAGQIDAVAAAAGARIVGNIAWSLDPRGEELVAVAPARPQPTACGRARHGLVESQIDRIRAMAASRCTDRQIAAVIGCTSSAVSKARIRHGIAPGVGNPTMAGAA